MFSHFEYNNSISKVFLVCQEESVCGFIPKNLANSLSETKL